MGYSPFSTRPTLLAYIKRKLGDPSHTIELNADQYNDCIDDAIQLFIEKAFEGSDQYYEELSIVTGQQTYTLDPEVMAVIGITQADFSQVNQVAMQQWYENIYQDIYSNSSEMILNYAMTTSYLNSVKDLIMKDVMYNFNSTTHELTLFETVTAENQTVLMHTIRHLGGLDGSSFDNIYGHRWIKARALANAWETWGDNLIKHDAPIWDGDIRINVDKIIEKGERAIEKSDESLKNEYTDTMDILPF